MSNTDLDAKEKLQEEFALRFTVNPELLVLKNAATTKYLSLLEREDLLYAPAEPEMPMTTVLSNHAHLTLTLLSALSTADILP